MKNIFEKTREDIKSYVRSLNTPENKIYQKNELLILSCFNKAQEILEENENLISNTSFAIEHLRAKLEINAGRLAEPLLKQGKNPKDDKECHKAFLAVAHLDLIEEYLSEL